jgi:integrase
MGHPDEWCSPGKEIDTYTPAEVRRLLTAARDDRLEAAWHLALYGLRRGEICGLAWADDIDLKARTLTIRESRVSVDGRPVSSPPKTDRGRRTLPLSDALTRTLRRARRRQAAERLKAGTLWQDTGYVVTNELGRPLHPDTLSDRWVVLTTAAGVRRLRLHEAATPAARSCIWRCADRGHCGVARARGQGVHHAHLHPLPRRRATRRRTPASRRVVTCT